MMLMTRVSMLVLVISLAATGAADAQLPGDLRAAMMARDTAFYAVDPATWERFTAATFTTVQQDGSFMTRAERLANLKTQTARPYVARSREQTERQGDLVVTRFFSGGFWVVEVWTRQTGAWQVLMSQVTTADVAQVVGPPPREQPVTRLRQHVEDLVGGGATSCGQFPVVAPLEPAASAAMLQRGIECIGQHARARTAAWLVVQVQGIDSWVAGGLLVDSKGRIQSYSYDSDPSGGSGARPRFELQPCPVPRVETGGAREARIVCGPSRRDI